MKIVNLPKKCPCCLHGYLENNEKNIISQCKLCDYWLYK